MIKYLSLFLIAVTMTLAACNSGSGENLEEKALLQTRIDSLQKKLDDAYKPGLGEFMSGIQVHHAKLWFAGSARNWDLAQFELEEIRESLNDIEKYCTDRQEVTSIPMILPVLDGVNTAIQQNDLPRFRNAFVLLTNTCNNCHQITKHAFNVIKAPDTPPFTNQVFTKKL